jgi:haloalkane dehalogenase
VDEGDGEPLLMVHGNPTWSFYFRTLIKSLSDCRRAIAPDHMGCGLSAKPAAVDYAYTLASRIHDLEALIQHLPPFDKKLTLVLHDWGGAIGMAYALKNPHQIGRLIIMNTAAFFPPANKRLPLRLWLVKYLSALAVPAVLGLNLFTRAALWMASYQGLAPPVKTGLIAPYNCWNNRIATLKFVQDIPASPKDSSYSIISQLDQNIHRLAHLPMLILWGAHDFVFDTDYLAEWQRRFPAAEIRLFADAGHYVLEDKPIQCAIIIKDFLKRHPV